MRDGEACACPALPCIDGIPPGGAPHLRLWDTYLPDDDEADVVMRALAIEVYWCECPTCGRRWGAAWGPGDDA